MFSLSTSWNVRQCLSARQIIEEIKTIGINIIELSFMHIRKDVEEIIQSVRDQQIRVTSVHNFCPVPEVVNYRGFVSPDYFSLAALQEDERKKAVFFTKQTIETAVNTGAQAVILHTGRVKIGDFTRRLAAFCDAGEKDSLKYIALKDKVQKMRAKKSGRHFTMLLKSLEELVKFAQCLNIKLCFENRVYFSEIPSLEEAAKLIDYFKENELFYWHDTGHAQVFENLGFCMHKQYLDELGHRIAGFHLHDVKNCMGDHLAPLMGNFDFNLLKPYLKPDHLKVLEPHPPVTAEQVKIGLSYLEQLFRL
ncbi:MAG: TIM barrel protein [Candidatus Omnitrophota bacterium]